ncbi:MAG: enoyl-CoA hydratase/isomerase family protein [Firmicutes bacterium]|nr:enoyl-CoA hydratase/isomerase family protein [Bacillota bacterium]
MGSEPEVIVEVEEPIAIIKLNRPHVLNAMTDAMMEMLLKKVQEVKADDRARVVIITGMGRGFCAGSDIEELATYSPDAARHHAAMGAEINAVIETMPKPVIAAINGPAVGGGFEMALACDIRIAARSARVGLPEVTLGSITGAGGSFRITRVVGSGVAKELLFTGRLVDAEEAYRLTLVNRVVDDGRVLEECRALALDLAGKSPTSLWLLKFLANKSFEIDWEVGMLLESLGNTQVATTKGFESGTRAFLQRRNKK